MTQERASIWKEHKMEYLSKRTGKLKKDAGELGLNQKQTAFVESMIQLIADMSVLIDDAVDAIDELDMRILELEHQHDDE